MSKRLCLLAVAAGMFGAALMPSAAPATTGGVLADFDARTGAIAPSAEQRAIVASLGAEAQWSDFGTPSSLVKSGG
jgi:hypothetical protein